MIKNVIFDIGMVLLDFEWNDYMQSLFDRRTAERVTEALWGTGYWHELDRAVLTDDEILDLFYSAAPDLRKEIRMTYDRIGECVGRRDWAIPLIEELKASGHKVYYLSNMSEHVLGSDPGAFDFVPHMDGGIYSCHVKTLKPEKEIYLKLIEKYGLVPEECIFIDDREDNVETGRSVGMKGIVFRSRQQMLEELQAATGCTLTDN